MMGDGVGALLAHLVGALRGVDWSLSREAVAVCVGMLAGYVALSTALQYLFYASPCCFRRRRWWMTQPKAGDALAPGVARRWWLPALGLKPDRPAALEWPRLLPTVNLCVACAMAGVAVELLQRGYGRMYWRVDDVDDGFGGRLALALSFVASVVQLIVMEYPWHRIMHLPFMYKRWHKIHHAHRAPQVFDDLTIHWMENLLWQVIMLSPPFLLPTHPLAFAAYMSYMGLAGVLDHSGIRAEIPGVYSAPHHDEHHRRFTVNYGFPHSAMDLLFGTFDGHCCGRRVRPHPRHKELNASGLIAGIRGPQFVAACLAALAVYVAVAGRISDVVLAGVAPPAAANATLHGAQL